jgi:8-oxo-dGTP pyrophosphatase MutT (NUDIX family)
MAIIQSAWWIVYYIDENWACRFLLIKRHAISKKIERVAPKWKIEAWETSENAALREIAEETWIPINQMIIQGKVWKTELRNNANQKWMMNKDVTYFIVKFSWNPKSVKIQDAEWYLGIYKRATIEDVLALVYYQDMRELIHQAYESIVNQWVKNSVKKDFINKL